MVAQRVTRSSPRHPEDFTQEPHVGQFSRTYYNKCVGHGRLLSEGPRRHLYLSSPSRSRGDFKSYNLRQLHRPRSEASRLWLFLRIEDGWGREEENARDATSQRETTMSRAAPALLGPLHRSIHFVPSPITWFSMTATTTTTNTLTVLSSVYFHVHARVRRQRETLAPFLSPPSWHHSRPGSVDYDHWQSVTVCFDPLNINILLSYFGPRSSTGTTRSTQFATPNSGMTFSRDIIELMLMLSRANTVTTAYAAQL